MTYIKFLLDYLLIFVLGGAVVFIFGYLTVDIIRLLIKYYNKK